MQPQAQVRDLGYTLGYRKSKGLKGCSKLQAEIRATVVRPSNERCYCGIQASLKTLAFKTMIPELVLSSSEAVLFIRDKFKLCWAPEDSNVEGSQSADKLARHCTKICSGEVHKASDKI